MAGKTVLPAVSIIIPAYNEEASIEVVVREILDIMTEQSVAHEIIVIDDGSTDDTAEKAEALNVRLIRHPENRGYGAAIKTGIRHAAHSLIAITDADQTYPNKEIPALLSEMDEYDMVVGARTGNKVQIPIIRRPAKWFLRKLANYLIGQEIPDLNSGLRVFRKDAAEKFIRLYPDGFSFTTTITLALMSNNYLVKFRPIDYYQRVGKSKIRPIRDTLGFIGLIIRTIMYYHPLKVFGPVASVLLLAGVVRGGFNVVLYHNLTTVDMLLIVTGIIVGAIGLLADLIDKRG